MMTADERTAQAYAWVDDCLAHTDPPLTFWQAAREILGLSR